MSDKQPTDGTCSECKQKVIWNKEPWDNISTCSFCGNSFCESCVAPDKRVDSDNSIKRESCPFCITWMREKAVIGKTFETTYDGHSVIVEITEIVKW